VDYESFVHELHQVQSRTSMLVTEMSGDTPADPAAIQRLLAELDTIVEELQVTDEEVRVLHHQLTDTQETLSADRDCYWDLFDQAPVAYLVTDRVGVIQEANQRAVSLLGVAQQFLVGRPLTMLAATEDRRMLRDRLNHPDGLNTGAWQLRLQPRRREPVSVAVSSSLIRDPAGNITRLRWLLMELPATSDGHTATPALERPPDGLHRVVQTAVPLLRVDGAGVMLANNDGVLCWVTGSNQTEQAFERAERDLGEGPCIDAFTSEEVVWTSDLRADPRWPRLGPAARANQIRGVLAAPVTLEDRTVGTCNALTTSPRAWTDSDIGAIRAYAAMLGQLIGAASDARHSGELAAQLQFALESRVLIEQAKGVLMERHGLDAQAAFTRLRRRARSSSRKLPEVAREIIDDRNW
jgi:PAS domain S-box-containing protein